MPARVLRYLAPRNPEEEALVEFTLFQVPRLTFQLAVEHLRNSGARYNSKSKSWVASLTEYHNTCAILTNKTKGEC